MTDLQVTLVAKPNSLTLVELLLPPEMVYTILDALYENTYNHPEENLETIQAIELYLGKQSLPYTREEYETHTQEDTTEAWKDIDLVFPHPVDN